MLPIFNHNIILDYNEEGNENVPSEDFEAGFGCVRIEVKKEAKPLPDPKLFWTKKDWAMYRAWQSHQKIINFNEDEYLKMHGI